MNPKPLTSKEYFRGLRIVYLGLIFGQVFFVFVTFILFQMGGIEMDGGELTDVFIYVLPLFILGGIVASQIMFKKRVKAAVARQKLMEKLTDYRAALVYRYAFLEAPTFFAIVVFMLTGELMFLGMTLLIILIFLFLKPTPDKAGNDLQLGLKEKQVLADPNSLVGEINIE